MKSGLLTLFMSFAVAGAIRSQAPSGSSAVIEKTNTEIGAVKELRVSVIKNKDTGNNSVSSWLRLEHVAKRSYVNDTRTDLGSLGEINQLISSLNDLKTTAEKSEGKSSQLSVQSSGGIEAGCSFVQVASKVSAAKAPSNQKVYVTTTEKLYEGKTVYKDEKGSFIWKPVASSESSAATGGSPGMWMFFVQVEKQVGASKVFLTAHEYKSFIELLERAKLKL